MEMYEHTFNTGMQAIFHVMSFIKLEWRSWYFSLSYLQGKRGQLVMLYGVDSYVSNDFPQELPDDFEIVVVLGLVCSLTIPSNASVWMVSTVSAIDLLVELYMFSTLPGTTFSCIDLF